MNSINTSMLHVNLAVDQSRIDMTQKASASLITKICDYIQHLIQQIAAYLSASNRPDLPSIQVSHPIADSAPLKPSSESIAHTILPGQPLSPLVQLPPLQITSPLPTTIRGTKDQHTGKQGADTSCCANAMTSLEMVFQHELTTITPDHLDRVITQGYQTHIQALETIQEGQKEILFGYEGTDLDRIIETTRLSPITLSSSFERSLVRGPLSTHTLENTPELRVQLFVNIYNQLADQLTTHPQGVGCIVTVNQQTYSLFVKPSQDDTIDYGLFDSHGEVFGEGAYLSYAQEPQKAAEQAAQLTGFVQIELNVHDDDLTPAQAKILREHLELSVADVNVVSLCTIYPYPKFEE